MEMCEMNVMDPSGHSNSIWDADVPAEVEAARATFNALIAKGYRAFHVKKDGTEGERMDTFDPRAGKMIMVPQLRGG